MNCPNCGTELPEGSAFCPDCGAPIGPAAPSVAPQPPVRRRALLLGAGVGAFAIVATAVVAVLLVVQPFGGDEEDETARDISDEDLALMVLPLEEFGPEYADLGLDREESGPQSRSDRLEGACDAEEAARAAEDMDSLGWERGYDQGYSSTQLLFEGDRGELFVVGSSIDLYADSRGAAGAFDALVAKARRNEEAGEYNCRVAFVEVDGIFDVPGIAHEAVLGVERLTNPERGISIVLTTAVFRRGRIVVGAVIARPDDRDVQDDVIELARELDRRILAVLRGTLPPASTVATPTLEVTVRPCLRVEEIGGLLERERVVFAEAFEDAVISTAYDFDFLESLPPGTSLEGFLFPGSYSLRHEMDSVEVAGTFLDAFDQHVTPKLRREIAAGSLSIHEAVTLASIVDREALMAEERPIIAQVLLKRLRLGMPLEADPTVQYALAADPSSVASYGYWKTQLSEEDLNVDSPYNTYRNRGLPPGPICSPRLDAILAVIRPADTDYLYYLTKPDGSHAFAETLEEHLQNIEEYRR